MEESKTIDQAIKEEKAYLKAASKALGADNENAKYFNDRKHYLQAGEKLADTDEKKALIFYQLVDLRNKITFLLYRLRKLTDELDVQFHGLSSIEEATKLVASYREEREEKQAKVKEQIDVITAAENSLDIFKAVCNGMSEEDAKAKLAEYEAQIKKAMGGAQ